MLTDPHRHGQGTFHVQPRFYYHPRCHRIGAHQSYRIGPQHHPSQLVWIGLALAEPGRPFLAREDHGHTVMNGATELVGDACDDSERLDRVAGTPILPVFAEARHGEWYAVGPDDRVGLLAGRSLLPLVEGIHRHDAALTTRERIAEGRLPRDRLGHRVDASRAHFDILGPPGHQPPPE